MLYQKKHVSKSTERSFSRKAFWNRSFSEKDIYSLVDKLNQTLLVSLYSLNTQLSFTDTFRAPIQLSFFGWELFLSLSLSIFRSLSLSIFPVHMPHLIFFISTLLARNGSIDYAVYLFPITDSNILSFMNYGLNVKHIALLCMNSSFFLFF